jgi:hypothetical protein
LAAPPSRPLLAGMLARTALVVAEPPPVLAVPRDAVLVDGARNYVFVRRADNTFERRAVTTGRTDDRLVEVTSGLSAGENVAVRGVAELQTAYATVK